MLDTSNKGFIVKMGEGELRLTDVRSALDQDGLGLQLVWCEGRLL